VERYTWIRLERVRHTVRQAPIQIAVCDVDPMTGQLVRVGPNELITGDPHILQKILMIRSAYRMSVRCELTLLTTICSERNDEKETALRAKFRKWLLKVCPYRVRPVTLGS
jgi:hypothetical protein